MFGTIQIIIGIVLAIAGGLTFLASLPEPSIAAGLVAVIGVFLVESVQLDRLEREDRERLERQNREDYERCERAIQERWERAKQEVREEGW